MSLHPQTISTNWHMVNLKKKYKISQIEKLYQHTNIDSQICKLAYNKLLLGIAEFTSEELAPLNINSDLYFVSE